MPNSSEPTSTTSRTGWIIVAILLFAVGGYFYNKGKQDSANKIRIEQRIAYLKDQIPHKQAELQLAANELDRINGFQILRTTDEKEQQLAQQNKVINRIREDVNSLQRELVSLQNSQKY